MLSAEAKIIGKLLPSRLCCWTEYCGTKNATFDDSDCNEEYDILDDDNTSLNEQDNYEDNDKILVQFNSEIINQKRRKSCIIFYINYRVNTQPDLHYWECLMLYLPWRNELTDLYGDHKSYKEHYNSKRESIKSTCLKYEKYNEALEDAVEEINEETKMGKIKTVTQILWQTPDRWLWIFYPDWCDDHTIHNIRTDLGCNDDEHYDNPVYEINTKLSDTDYFKLMQSFNRKQIEICTHIIQHIDTTQEQMFMFLEGSAGIGTTQCAKAIYESVNRYFGCKPGEDPNAITTQQLAPNWDGMISNRQ